MVSSSQAECRDPSIALRMGSPERLRVDLNRYLVASESDVDSDWRDVLEGLALISIAPSDSASILSSYSTARLGTSTPRHASWPERLPAVGHHLDVVWLGTPEHV
jgi:hypothetical protein